MDISIIIPVFNAGDKIYRCIDSIKKQKTKRSFEIILVDDGSTDNAIQQIQDDKVKVFRQSNQGPAAARNLGVEKSNGEIILFTDADCEPLEDWIEEMVCPLEGSFISGVKGSYLTRQKKLVARFVQLEYESKYERMKKDRHIDFIDTYSAGFKRKDFICVGSYDTRFPTASVEDQEFSFRMWEKGYRMVFNPDAKVYHTHSDNIFNYMKKKFCIGFWKALVLKTHPQKILRDSHTPQSLKFEMIFSMLFLIFLLLWPLKKGFLFFAPFPLLGFSMTISPFVIKTLKKDLLVSLFSPLILFARAISLSIGLIAGSIHIMNRQHKKQAEKIDSESPILSRTQIVS